MLRFAGSHQLKLLHREQGKLNKTEWCTVKTFHNYTGCINTPPPTPVFLLEGEKRAGVGKEKGRRKARERERRRKERFYDEHLFSVEMLYNIFKCKLTASQASANRFFVCIHMYYRYPYAYVCICILIRVFSHGPILAKHSMKNKKMV